MSVSISDLKKVYIATFEARNKWRNILLVLDLSKATIESISKRWQDNPDDCYREGLSEWLESGERSWGDLVEALSSPIVGHSDIAMVIRRDYIPHVQSTGSILPAISVTSSTPSIPNHQKISENLMIFTNESLGSGAFGVVFKGSYKDSVCAVKVLHQVALQMRTNLPSGEGNAKTIEAFDHECELLKSFRHPNIVQHLSTDEHPSSSSTMLVTELMDCNLRSYLSGLGEESLTSHCQVSLSKDVASGLAYIHSRRIVHRDLCGDNVLLKLSQPVPIAKISDFGMSRLLDPTQMSSTLTAIGHRMGYLPPEALRLDNEEYDHSLDVFSLGVIMVQILHKVETVKTAKDRSFLVSQIPPTHRLKSIIGNCLQEDKKRRPTAKDICTSLESDVTVEVDNQDIYDHLTLRATRWYDCFTRCLKRDRTPFRPRVDYSLSTISEGTPDYSPPHDLGVMAYHDLGVVPDEKESVISGPIEVECFAAHVEKFNADRQLLFQEEYEWIQTNSPWHPAEASNHLINDDKNRYRNILAFDYSRVKLSPEIDVECSDYINANYIQGYSGNNEYIATQGPLEQTLTDFWKMVWEQNTQTIVMITNLIEVGKLKCTQYWPNNGTEVYGRIKVTLAGVAELPNYVIRSFLVSLFMSSENDSRLVLQFQFTRWPDYGVPKLAMPLLDFIKAINTSNPPNAGPIVVHCSAGVGRSGTVIAIDFCLKQLKADGFVNPSGFVQQMRNQRNYMVQIEQQYTFIHFALLEAITRKDTSYMIPEFMDLYGSGPLRTEKMFMGEEFERVGRVKTMSKKSSYQQKIKRKGVPKRHFSSFLGQSAVPPVEEPFSAHYMDTYHDTRRLIVADGPKEESVQKWWLMVWDEDVTYIVNLSPQDEETFQYWPKGGCVQHGDITVEVEIETSEHSYLHRKIKLTNAKVDGVFRRVVQFHFIGWTTQFLPSVPDFVGFMINVMERAESLKKNQRVLTHDTDSLGPCGVMCSLFYLFERVRTEKIVDVFQAVLMVTLQRPGSVKTVQEYAFIYDCAYEFIRIQSDLRHETQNH